LLQGSFLLMAVPAGAVVVPVQVVVVLVQVVVVLVQEMLPYNHRQHLLNNLQ